jgi:hypothetical protein
MPRVTIGLALLLTLCCAAAATTQPAVVEVRDCPADVGCRSGYTCRCDEAGNVITEAYDEDEDGVVDSEIRRTWDAQNRLLSREHDHDADGDAEWRETYAYDESGNRTITARDADGDGRPDVVWHYAPPCAAPYRDCEVTSIEEPTSSLSPAEVAECYAKLAEWSEGIQRAGLGEWSIERPVLVEALASESCTLQSLVPERIERRGTSLPVLRASYPDGARRLWTLLGLLEQDVVLAIDGRAIADDTTAEEFLRAASEPGRHEIEAAHQGRERTLVWAVSESPRRIRAGGP